jgi:hypothetical protein
VKGTDFRWVGACLTQYQFKWSYCLKGNIFFLEKDGHKLARSVCSSQSIWSLSDDDVSYNSKWYLSDKQKLTRIYSYPLMFLNKYMISHKQCGNQISETNTNKFASQCYRTKSGKKLRRAQEKIRTAPSSLSQSEKRRGSMDVMLFLVSHLISNQWMLLHHLILRQSHWRHGHCD